MAESQTYTTGAKAAHWSIFVLVVAQFIAAWTMGPHDEGQKVDATSNVHATIGVLIIILATWRLFTRLSNPVAPSTHIPRWQQIVGWATHRLLYVLLIVMPASGLLAASNEGAMFQLFGIIPLPSLAAPDSALGEFGEETHEILANVLMGVIALHVAAALYHGIFRGDDVLERMLP